MPTYTFTVVAVGEDLQSDENLKTLLDSGCDDATVGRVEDLQYLAFIREADSFGEAVLSAVNAVEKVSGVNVINVSTDGSVKRPQFSPDRVQAALRRVDGVPPAHCRPRLRHPRRSARHQPAPDPRRAPLAGTQPRRGLTLLGRISKSGR